MTAFGSLDIATGIGHSARVPDEVRALDLGFAGLGSYSIFEVSDSSWKRHIIEQNRRCFPRTPPHYESLRHFVVTFQDSTFECLAQELTARSMEGH